MDKLKLKWFYFCLWLRQKVDSLFYKSKYAAFDSIWKIEVEKIWEKEKYGELPLCPRCEGPLANATYADTIEEMTKHHPPCPLCGGDVRVCPCMWFGRKLTASLREK